MPIYEFYCGKCNTVFNFFSKTVNTEKVPNCPHCKDITLNRRMSLFASVSGKKGEEGADMPFDEARIEKAMSMLADEAGRISEDDPRQAAGLMKKLSDATGINMGPGMEEALRRLERGEDPDKIEEEMGDVLEREEPFIIEGKGRAGSRKPSPKIDETLYEL
ncbi:MAG: zinc ribbon domain-containing protein [Nitrospiraceae bacterium]|nr:MAG: zinc ribbon domain-containing protein [Nitrospiraceae bacterium]